MGRKKCGRLPNSWLSSSVGRTADQLELLTHYGHVRIWLLADAPALSREESPVSFPPVAETLVALAFECGEAVADPVERDDLDMSRFDDAQWSALPIGYHAEGANFREGLVGVLVGPEKTRGGALLAGQNESSERVCARLVVVEVERLIEQWRSVICDRSLKLIPERLNTCRNVHQSLLLPNDRRCASPDPHQARVTATELDALDLVSR